jgi:hypothetical protein
MNRKLTIKGTTGRYDVPSFVWSENEKLSITFDIRETRVGRFYAVIRCGKRVMEFSLAKYQTVEIPAEFIKSGGFEPLNISLEFWNASGTAVIVPSDPKRGGYFVEPLYFRRVEETTTAIAWLQDVESKLNATNARIDETNALLQQQQEQLDGVPATIKTAVDEAIVYLTNGDPLKS